MTLLEKLETHLALGLSTPGFHLSNDDIREIVVALRAQQEPDSPECFYCCGTGRHHGAFGGPGWPRCGYCNGSGKAAR